MRIRVLQSIYEYVIAKVGRYRLKKMFWNKDRRDNEHKAGQYETYKEWKGELSELFLKKFGLEPRHTKEFGLLF